MANKNKKTSIFKSRRFKYGSISVLLTIVFIAAIIAFNAVFTAIASKNLWYIDMTQEQVYGISDAGLTMLDDLKDSGKKFTIIFCEDPDKLDAANTTNLVHTLAKAFKNACDFIDIEYIDVITSPQLVDKYKSTAATIIKQTSVIIATDSDYKLFQLESFFVISEEDNSLFGFKGELAILTALVQMSGDNPIAYFSIGHGEKTKESGIYSLFETAGYDVREIDLTKEEISEGAQVLVINDPKYDFAGGTALDDSSNEIKKIDDFLDGLGHMMVFLDPATQKLPELEDYLYEWGFEFEDAVIKDYSNSVSTDGYSLIAEYTTEGYGASIHEYLRSLANPPKTIVRYASPINLWFNSRGGRETAVILKSNQASVAYDVNTGEELSSGQYNLLAISADTVYDGESDYTSYVLVGGTTYFSDADYLHNKSYGNSDILYTFMKTVGKDTVPLDITFKVFDDNSLDITVAEANSWTVFVTVFLPAVALVVGAVVFLRRRHL